MSLYSTHRQRAATLLLFIALTVAPAAARTDPDGPIHGFSELSRAYVALAIQGDLSAAPALFDQSIGAGAAGSALRAEFDRRFLAAASDQARATDPAGEVAGAYRRYWRRVLMREAADTTADAALGSELAGLAAALLDPAPGASPETLAAQILTDAGWRHSLSAAPPLRDLFAWKTERHASYRVELTDVTVPVEVVFIHDFLVQGWKDYASLGLASTSGWVEDGRLYCVAWAYDPSSEHFAVSFLKHEARHLADLQRFPDMTTTELEYRAKLTELAFANRELGRTWADFRAKAADNPDAPHAHANWRVVRDVGALLGFDAKTQAPDLIAGPVARQLNRAARHLLKENTRRHAERDTRETG